MSLPAWPGADVVYSRCYKILDHMAKNGHVTRRKQGRALVCDVSAEMTDIIDALNKGNEEFLKATVQQNLSLVFPAPAASAT